MKTTKKTLLIALITVISGVALMTSATSCNRAITYEDGMLTTMISTPTSQPTTSSKSTARLKTTIRRDTNSEQRPNMRLRQKTTKTLAF